MCLNHACQKSNFKALTFQNGKSYSLPINIHDLHWENVESYKAFFFFFFLGTVGNTTARTVNKARPTGVLPYFISDES